MKSAWLIAALFVFVGSWSAADDSVEEIIVSVPRTIIETEMHDYGIVHVRYRDWDSASALRFDHVSSVERASDVPRESDGFGVKLLVKSTPRQLISVAEVWSHPELLHRRTGQLRQYTILLHKLDPPNVYTFYFPSDEFETLPAGDWTLQLFSVDEIGFRSHNLEFYDDPTQFSADGLKPLFVFQFQVQPQ
jgi:hypothetical protein